MEARTKHLIEEGLARREGERVVFARNLLGTLRQRELDALGEKLCHEIGIPFRQTEAGEYVAGTYRQRFTLASPDRWASHIAAASKRFAIPERWIGAVMAAESSGDTVALSPKGAVDLMQIMPPTWNELRTKHGLGHDPWRPRDNIMAGVAYLREMYDRYGSVDAMLAAYNAGPARYDEHRARGRALPPETIAYVAKIAPIIDGKAAITSTTGRRRPASSWSRASIFAGRSTSNAQDDRMTDDRPSGRSSDGQAVVNLSALTPLSDGLFVYRSRLEGAEP